jgi:hypothetical protein
MPSGAYRSPTVRHKRLTAELRRLRSDSRLTRDDVASRLEWHPTKVTRIETGQWTRLNPRRAPGQRNGLGARSVGARRGTSAGPRTRRPPVPTQRAPGDRAKITVKVVRPRFAVNRDLTVIDI